MRDTKQRKTILDILKGSKDHPSADRVYDLVRKKIPKISLGTVYRNLEVLVAQGEIRKINSGAGQSRFDADLSDHVHFRCINCGKLEDVSGQFKSDLFVSDQHDERKILGSYVEYYGLCKKCSNSKE